MAFKIELLNFRHGEDNVKQASYSPLEGLIAQDSLDMTPGAEFHS